MAPPLPDIRTLPDLLQRTRSDTTAVVVPGGASVTYGGLQEQVEELARRLRGAGVEPGDSVSIVLGNDLPFLVAFLAVTRAGAMAAPLNPAYTSEELQFYMGDAGAKTAVLALGDGQAREAAEALGIPALEAVMEEQGTVSLRREGVAVQAAASPSLPEASLAALFLHTSGTTSRPKGVPLSHGNLVASIQNIADTYQLTSDDSALAVMPLFHVHGLIGVVLSTLATGGTVIAPPRFSAGAFWGDAAAHGATWYSAVPTIHQILLSRADEDEAPEGQFRFIRSCSAALSPVLLEGLESRFGAPVLEAYGMTEASHQMASNPLPPGDRKPGSVGPGTGTTQVAVMDDAGRLLETTETGEVVVQGPNVMAGYKDNPEANAVSFTNGWFRTGDQGVIDRGGYLQLTGRLKEMINRGGEKIAPAEIDEVLSRHPSIADAITFGMPDPKYGEEVHAAVVLRGDATEREVQDFCHEHLVNFKVPKTVHFLDQLPRTATGKVQRRRVAALFEQEPG